MQLPNLIIIGAAKSGTTSLHAYLDEHPQIYMSKIKETNYFAYNGKNTKNFLGKKATVHFPVKTFEQYSDLFKNTSKYKVVGEASPIYIESPIAGKRIYDLLPDAKIIAILRNPVERAFSAYLMKLRLGGDKPDRIEKKLDEKSHYVQAGLYNEKLERYYKLFPCNQIKVCIFEDLKSDSKAFIKDVYKFLRVDENFSPNLDIKYNTGNGLPKSGIISQFLRITRKISRNYPVKEVTPGKVKELYGWIKKINEGNKPSLSKELRERLNSIYFEDVMKLEKLINKDLKRWFEEKSF